MSQDEEISFSEFIKSMPHVLLFGLGGVSAVIIDRFFTLSFFYRFQPLRYFVFLIMFFIIGLMFYIGYKRDENTISNLDSHFTGNRFFFTIKAVLILYAYINNYIINYEIIKQYTNIISYDQTFGLFRSLAFSGYFSILEKALSFGKKALISEEKRL